MTEAVMTRQWMLQAQSLDREQARNWVIFMRLSKPHVIRLKSPDNGPAFKRTLTVFD